MLEFTLPSKEELESTSKKLNAQGAEKEIVDLKAVLRGNTLGDPYDLAFGLVVGMQIMKNRFEVSSYNSLEDKENI